MPRLRLIDTDQGRVWARRNMLPEFSPAEGTGIMAVSAQVAIYPLRQERLTPAVEAVQEALRDHGLQAESGPMSTYVVGEDEAVFAALRLHDLRAWGTLL